MSEVATGLQAVTPGGGLLVLALMVPVTGALLAILCGGRHGERIALGAMALGVGVAAAIVAALLRSGAPLVYWLGGWAPPLGIALRADGLSAAMLLAAALLVGATALYARADFATPPAANEARAPYAFWPLLLAVWGALNAAFITGDLFTGYVALELLTFAAVPLVCLDGRAETLAAALRYLLFALIGSVFYLVGAVLLYGVAGTLDIALLAARLGREPTTVVALSLMTVGLLAKSALFPLHLWLPPAHAGAPPAASAVLSALVVKGSFFLVVRLWFDVAPGLPGVAGTQLLAALGAAAILFGNALALRQERLKLMVAYSTVAQLGYLFLMFPLALAADGRLAAGAALSGGVLQAIAHATAKAAMFLAAGLIGGALGHDRVAGLGGSARALPMTVLAFAFAGVALIGLPPSGGFLAKWLLLGTAVTSGQWWWAAVIVIGGLLTAAYVWRVLAATLAAAPEPAAVPALVSPRREALVLALAIGSLLLGAVAFAPGDLLLIGRGGAGAAP